MPAVYGIPNPVRPFLPVAQVQAAGSWSSSLSVTLPSTPTGFILAGISSDSGGGTSVSCSGYTFTILKQVSVATTTELWLGTPTGAARGTVVTFSGSYSGGYYNPVAVEISAITVQGAFITIPYC